MPMLGPAVATAGIHRAGIAVAPAIAVGILLLRQLMFIRRFNPLLARSSRLSRVFWGKIGGFELNLIKFKFYFSVYSVMPYWLHHDSAYVPPKLWYFIHHRETKEQENL